MLSQASQTSARRAEIRLDRTASSASVRSQIRTDHDGNTPCSFEWAIGLDSLPAFLTLADICTRICRSHSWAYESGLVPKFDKHGQKVKGERTPPWPWEVLPDPIVKVGKKVWASGSFHSWLARMRARAEHVELSSTRSKGGRSHA